MISIPKWLYWIISICTTIALILVGTAFFTEPQFTSDLLLLAGMSLLSAYIVTSFWYVKSLFNVHYGVSEILKKFGKITYKKYPIQKLKAPLWNWQFLIDTTSLFVINTKRKKQCWCFINLICHSSLVFARILVIQ